MARMRCTCGHVFKILDFPTPNGYFVISEPDFNQVGDHVDRRTLDLLIARAGLMYRCTQCGEVIVRWRRGSPWEFYAPRHSTSGSTAGEETNPTCMDRAPLDDQTDPNGESTRGPS
jgi:hypothetical protein